MSLGSLRGCDQVTNFSLVLSSLPLSLPVCSEEDIAALKAEIERLKTVAHATAFPEVQARNEFHRKRILITGGAGFVGSHLVDYLMLQGHEVTVLDNFFTGRKKNVQHWFVGEGEERGGG